MDGLGRTQKSGDKGLGIVSAGSLVNTSRTDGVPRKPGETYTAEFDFMAGLTPGTLDNPQNGLMLLLGDREVKPAERWNIVFEIDPQGNCPQGNWEIKGSLGQWVSYAKLPSEAIVKRPKTGKMAVSKWHHFKLEIQKLETEHSFKSSLKITASDGEELVNWFGREVTVPADISFWNEEEIYFAIPGRDSIKGMFVIDNLTVSSEKK